jgi:hypothetical protein
MIYSAIPALKTVLRSNEDGLANKGEISNAALVALSPHPLSSPCSPAADPSTASYPVCISRTTTPPLPSACSSAANARLQVRTASPALPPPHAPRTPLTIPYARLPSYASAEVLQWVQVDLVLLCQVLSECCSYLDPLPLPGRADVPAEEGLEE